MRGDEDALRAKNEVLERELEEARAALAQARAPRDRARASSTSDLITSLRSRARGVLAWLAPSSAARWGWTRALGLGVWVALLTAGSTVAMSLSAAYFDAVAISPPESSPLFWIAMGWLFVGPGVLTWFIARLLAAPSPRAAGWLGGIAVFLASFAPSAHPVLQDGVRMMLLGDGSGSLETVAAQPTIAWAHLEPAWIGPQIGEGLSVSERTDSEGRTTTSSSQSYCAPLVPSPGWTGPVYFVCCDHAREGLPAAPGAGVMEGRLTRAFTPDDRAVAALAAQGVAIAPNARVVSITGPREQTLALGLAGFVLVSLLGTILSALVTVRGAVERDAPSSR